MIQLNQPVIGEEEIANVVQALRESFVSGLVGRFIEQFEKEFSAYCGLQYGVSTTSGTTALHLALATLDIGSGNEVIVPTYTNIAPVFAVLYCGATPKLVDCELNTFNMDVKHLEEQITARSRAIIVVHLYGHPIDMDKVLSVARRHNLRVIEDAAEAHGAKVRGARVGSLGDVGCFSFLANKIITTGEGGMLVTNDRELSEKARLLRNLSFSSDRKFLHRQLGFNYRFSNVLAAIGVGQLKHIDQFSMRRRQIAARYTQYLQGIEGLTLPVEYDWAFHAYWVYFILVNPFNFGRTRDEVIQLMKEKGVETREAFIPMHLQPVFLQRGLFRSEHHQSSEEVSKRGFYLPISPSMPNSEVDYVAETLASLKQ